MAKKTQAQKTAWKMVLELTGDGFLNDPWRIKQAREFAAIAENTPLPEYGHENGKKQYPQETIEGVRTDYVANVAMATICKKWKVPRSDFRELVADEELARQRAETRDKGKLGRWSDEQLAWVKKQYIEGGVLKDILAEVDMPRGCFQDHVRTPELAKARQDYKNRRAERGRREILVRYENGEKLEELYADFGQSFVYRTLRSANKTDRRGIKLKVTDIETGAVRYYRSIKQAARCMAYSEYDVSKMIMVGESPEGCLMEVCK